MIADRLEQIASRLRNLDEAQAGQRTDQDIQTVSVGELLDLIDEEFELS